jgi:hypothetical protein
MCPRIRRGIHASATASFANKRAGWGFDVGVEILTGALAVLPLFLALFVDR